MKVVINTCFGGFGLSPDASVKLNRLKGKQVVDPSYGYLEGGVDRTDEDLISVIEEMGHAASGSFASLEVIEIDEPFIIDEYDGNESIMTLSDFMESAYNKPTLSFKE